jgi:hypothetical protein
MDDELPQPLYQPATPPAGWWKSPASLATDPAFLRVDTEHRLAAIGLYTAAIGWTLTHSSAQGWVPAAAMLYGQVCAAPQQQVQAVLDALVSGGLFLPASVDGMNGYVVAGARKAVQERFARQESASGAGKRSQEARTGKPAEVDPPKFDRQGRRVLDANRKVDWSKETGDL